MRETLLMIPGTLCNTLLFKHQIADLTDIADCQVANHSSSDDLKDVAAHILASVSGRFSVMGLSYGGIIAFEMIRQAPNRIQKLILLNTNHKKPSETTRANQERFLGMAALGNFRNITTDFLKDAMLHPKHAAKAELRTEILQMAMDTGETAFFRQIKAQLNRPDSTQDLSHIQCPVLIMTGREDKVCTPELHQEMARLIPHATLKIIEECGHLSTMEQPKKVNLIIRHWWLQQNKVCEEIN